MALNTQEKIVVSGLVSHVSQLMSLIEKLAAIQQLQSDSGLGPLAAQDLIDAEFEWFIGAELVADFNAVTAVRAVVKNSTQRVALNRLR